ncbi:MAG: potassium-transporting ATPase subunit KdpA [Deltaproteobacteria bacterium]|nr:potassium-transporting ATPase subunit KdpA [Deltaproteobacteria bacterium]
MNALIAIKILGFFGLLTLLAMPLGNYMARVYRGENRFSRKILGPLERLLLRMAGVAEDADTHWKTYAKHLLIFNLLGFFAVYALERLQGFLPGNPAGFGAVSPQVAFNTAVSFVTNTNWQAYAGEAVMSQLTQMAGLTVQNFLSAATGMAVAVALTRSFTRNSEDGIGCFWTDLVRGVVYILLPLALVFSVFLVSQGLVQTFDAKAEIALAAPVADSNGNPVESVSLALGPVASQVAVKQLGTNGGGYYNANSAHPFENPTPLSNFAELLAILLIPAAFCFFFGRMVKAQRQGYVLFAVMMAVILPLSFLCAGAELSGNPALDSAGVDQKAGAFQSGGNMEGKEVRFGAAESALWAVATTAASNGSVNATHDSFTPLGGLIPMWLIQLGEVVFGGVGSGLYGMILFAVVAVFIAGLMVGRTPEYLGKKLSAYEMQAASLGILIPPAFVLLGTAMACVTLSGHATVANPGPHGFSELLYAYSSAANNNGSAFAGLDASNLFHTVATGLCMLAGRFWVIVPVLALAGSLARKRTVPASSGTLPTDTVLFAALLLGTLVLVGALTFIPALALGPLVEHLMLFK